MDREYSIIQEAMRMGRKPKSTGEEVKGFFSDRLGDLSALLFRTLGVVIGLLVIAPVLAYPVQWAINHAGPLNLPQVTFLQTASILFLGMVPVRFFYFLRHRSMTNDWTRMDLEYFR